MSLKTKLQLILLPILIMYFIVYYIDEKYFYDTEYIKNFSTLENNSFNGSYLELIKEIEEFSDLNKIKILNIAYKKTSLHISANSSLSKFKKLIYKLETINNYSNIKSIDVNKQETFSYKIELTFDKYFFKSINKKQINILENKQPIKLRAIIGNYALINTKWLKVDDVFNGFRIIEINDKYVRIEKKSKSLLLKVRKDEKVIDKVY